MNLMIKLFLTWSYLPPLIFVFNCFWIPHFDCCCYCFGTRDDGTKRAGGRTPLQVLAGILTLSQPGGADSAHQIKVHIF